ncbi:MAG TPA: hypothetical protein VJ742_12090 [Nitrososphaera sp.]|nr:hypothetical protein [Nitrososphaera sp.]
MTGSELISEERTRQIEAEAWSLEHDQKTNLDEQLRWAAACYLLSGRLTIEDRDVVDCFWPWEPFWWKPGDEVRNLVKAGALIAAEIDRIQRTEALKSASKQD